MDNQEASPTIPPSYIRVSAIVWACGRGQTHRQTQTRVTTIHLTTIRLTRNVTRAFTAHFYLYFPGHATGAGQPA